MKYPLLLTLAFLVSLETALAATKTASTVGNVRWSNPNAWTPNGVPAVGDDVNVPNGANVIFDAVTPRLKTVSIAQGGSLRFDNGGGTNETEIILRANTILVAGYLEIGREECLFTRKARIVLINDVAPMLRGDDLLRDANALVVAPYGTKMLAVYQNGRWEAHAQGRNPTWTQIAADIAVGANSFSVIRDVDWKVGDEIIVATTDYAISQTERFAITAINGRTITVNGTFRYNHFGRVLNYDGYAVDMRAEVAVLTSNVVVEGDMVNSVPFVDPNAFYNTQEVQYGGHTISIHQSIVRIEGLQFRYMGQAGRLARYPVHWHHRVDAPGQYLKRTTIHDSYHRGVTIHDTNYVLVQDVVAYNVLGHSIYLEDGTEVKNQFIDVLAVTSRPVGASNQVGSLIEPACATNPPGLRAQFLDDTPSGFWITNVNNTFIGCHAAGHTYGFWIRVDLVFSEPGYPCTTCSCPTSSKVQLPTINGYGLVMVDNVAHSNDQSGIWVKENWVPRKDGDTGHPDFEYPQLIQGFSAYKNRMGLEIYGIGAVNFDYIIAADNGIGVVVDWERNYVTNWTRTVIIGETENFGNPQSSWPQKTSCSAVFPGQQRTYIDNGGTANAGLKMADRWFNWDDISFINLLPFCGQTVDPISQYPGGTLGAIRFTDRLFVALPPDRSIKNMKLNKTFIYKVKGNSASVDTYTPADILYGGGYYDADGSFPCSQPGAYFFHNTPGVVTANCEFRSNWNMFYCPPLPNGAKYRQLQVELVRQYTSYTTTNNLIATWECGNTLQAKGGVDSFYFNIRTDKRYVMQFTNNYVPPGLRFSPSIDQASGVRFEGVEVVFVLPGRWTFELYSLTRNTNNYYVPTWTPSTAYTAECHCGTTYVRLNVFPGRWETDLRINADNTIACDNTCGNPWPAPAPTGYTCGPNPTSNNKNLTTCQMKPLQSAQRTGVTRPSAQPYSAPSAVPQDIGICFNTVPTSNPSSQPSGTVSGTATNTVTRTVTNTNSGTVSNTASNTVTRTVSNTNSGTVSNTNSGTVSNTNSGTVSDTNTGTVSNTVSDTNGGNSTASGTAERESAATSFAALTMLLFAILCTLL